MKCWSIRELQASLNQCNEKYSYAKINFTSALTVYFFEKNRALTEDNFGTVFVNRQTPEMEFLNGIFSWGFWT